MSRANCYTHTILYDMTDNTTIESAKIEAGKRTYFPSVKWTKENSKYLKICESKQMEDGHFERHQVLIFEEDINKITESLQHLLRHFHKSGS